MKTTPKKNGGFTLVELIVVIAILAILAAVAIPAYSGYIEKAEEANDLQLLGAVSTAFNSACVENGIYDLSQMVGTEIELDENGYVVGISSSATLSNAPAAADPLFASFVLYYGDNINTPFKVFIQIVYTTEGFVGYSKDDCATVALPGGGTLYLTPAQVELLKDSTYASDIGGLMIQVDGVSTLVTGLLADGGEGVAEQVLGEYLTNEAYLTGAIVALGGTVDPDNEDLLGQYVAVVDQFKENQAKQQIADKYGVNVEDINIDDYAEDYEAVSSQVDKNILIMSVAQNASKQNASDVMSIINSDNPKTDLLKAMTGANGADGMGQAALVYGAFTAYAMSDSATEVAKQALADSSKDGGDPTAVFDVLTGSELEAFQAYMADTKGQNDLNACIEAMGVIDNTSKDQNATAGLMANGFANDDFVAALQDLLK